MNVQLGLGTSRTSAAFKKSLFLQRAGDLQLQLQMQMQMQMQVRCGVEERVAMQKIYRLRAA